VRRRTELAHRVAWVIAFGPIPPGKFVLHHCDEPLCIRPHHLFLGTQAENLADMAAKGRGRTSQFSTAEKNAIRKRYRDGELQREIATALDVSQGLISLIVNEQE